MKKVTLITGFLLTTCCIQAQNGGFPKSAAEDKNSTMSEAYWAIWNPEVQQKIDQDIEANRKATAVVTLPDAAPGTPVEIEQISHDFIFGAHIFNYNQLGSEASNQKYKDLYGDLFNSGTVAFYWKTFETEPGKPRFTGEYRDSEAYWNAQQNPKAEPHWRRPASDPAVDFCLEKGIRVHGHPLIWGNRKWHNPNWIIQEYMTPEEKQKMDALIVEYGSVENYLDSEKYSEVYNNMSVEELEAEFPEFAKTLKGLFEKRITDIAAHYGGKIASWDVVNESASDFSKGRMVPGSGLMKSVYGIMPGDYTYEAFQTAQTNFPDSVALNINDYWTGPEYPAQIKELQSRGCKIDIAGAQMHLFQPQQCLDIAAGKAIQTPQQVYDVMLPIGETGLPIHLSEITITSPGTDEKGQEIQAIIAQNLYRLWFSIEPMMGITWWNVVDDCGAPGEPSVSGLFTRDMEPKQSYYALNNLINNEWKTNLTAEADKKGQVEFRGFKGNYLIKYKDKTGKEQVLAYDLN